MTVRRLCLTVCVVGLQASVTAPAPRAGTPSVPLAAVDFLLTAACRLTFAGATGPARVRLFMAAMHRCGLRRSGAAAK
jgi:hypothetical protein